MSWSAFFKFYDERKHALTSCIIYTRVSLNFETTCAIPGPECHGSWMFQPERLFGYSLSSSAPSPQAQTSH